MMLIRLNCSIELLKGVLVFRLIKNQLQTKPLI